MKRLLVALSAKYIHTSPAVWMLREACALRGIAVDVLEAEAAKPADALLRDILRRAPDVVGFSCYIWNIDKVRRLTAALRRALPGCVVLWGGPEVSFDAQARMGEPIAPDAILCGEGEETLPEVLLRLQRGEPVEPVVRAKPVRPQDWLHLYPPGSMADEHRLHYVETARGCPFSCGFCVSGREGGVRALPEESAAQRLLDLRDAGARTVKVLDRTFNFDAPRARAIWQTLIREGGSACYHFEIAAHLLEEEDIALLRSAPKGLFQLEIGVQSTRPETLAQVDRRQDFDKLRRAVRALRDADNIHLHLDLIAGLPGEDYASFARSFDDVLALRPHVLQLGFLKLLPGTLLRETFDREGWPYDPAPPYEVIATDALSRQDLLRLHDVEEVFSHLYNSGRLERAARRWLGSFAAYEALAQALRGEGFLDAPRAPIAWLDALGRHLPPDAEPDLRFDHLAAGSREYRPWMRPESRPDLLRGLELPPGIRRRAHAEGVGGEVYVFMPGQKGMPIGSFLKGAVSAAD